MIIPRMFWTGCDIITLYYIYVHHPQLTDSPRESPQQSPWLGTDTPGWPSGCRFRKIPT